MDLINSIAGIITQPVVYWLFVLFVAGMVSYLGYKTFNNYKLMADAVEDRNAAEKELAAVNAKIEDLKKRLAAELEANIRGAKK